MAIIMSIRKFLRLDKSTLHLDTEFINSAGLWMTEKDELMKEVHYGCLVGGDYSHSPNNHVLLLSNNQINDVVHINHDMHFHF